jgi:uncharacterized protein
MLIGVTADEIKELLGLQPHPTCGFVAESYRSSHRIPTSDLPQGYQGDHAYGSVLYFLVTDDAHMQLHRIRPDQMYHHYLGDPLEVLMLRQDGTGQVATVGHDLAAGMRPQLVIPGGTWHVSRLRPGGDYALLSTTEWPGVEPSDVERPDLDALISAYPDFRQQIQAFTAPPRAHTTPAPSG